MRTDLSCAQAARLAAWLSPSFPIGAYSYSHGIERAVELGEIASEASLAIWLDGLLRFGSGRNEAVLFACAWSATSSREHWLEVAEVAAAMRPTRELALEATCQGAAFLTAVAQAWPNEEVARIVRWQAEAGVPAVLPVVAGSACRAHRLPCAGSLALYLHAFAANLVSAGVRLVPLGQSAGLRLVAALEPTVLGCAEAAVGASLHDLGAAAPMAEILSMQHETQTTRLFRS